jgi:2-keto-4-pentenoate hydratase
MIDKKRVRGLSELLLHAHHTGVMVAIEPTFNLESTDEAYWVQEVVLRGIDPRRPIAWKISPPKEGVPMMSSPSPFKNVKASPAEFMATNRVLGVEAEIAYRFGKAPKTKGKAADVASAIDEAFVLIEFCETRYYNVEELGALMRVADFQSHGGFAIGTGTREWRDLDYASQEVELHVNGKKVVAKKGSHPSGDPYALAEFAATHCAERGMPLAAGDIVTTGTWTGMTPVKPGDEVVARFPGIGECSLKVNG